jgi:hypothetical protein
MQDIDRRILLRRAMCGAVVATAAAAGLTAELSTTANATPLALGKPLPGRIDGVVQQAQVVVVPPRRRWRRRRRWVCWWRRGRRVCGWRWV